jgi:hypothetical protein
MTSSSDCMYSRIDIVCWAETKRAFGDSKNVQIEDRARVMEFKSVAWNKTRLSMLGRDVVERGAGSNRISKGLQHDKLPNLEAPHCIRIGDGVLTFR